MLPCTFICGIFSSFGDRQGVDYSLEIFPPRKVAVAFPYDGEHQVLAMREREIRGVDCYIVSRSPYTQRGERRPLPSVPSRIGNVKVVVIDLLQNHHAASAPWGQESAIREALLRGVVPCNLTWDDVLVVSDADEVVSSEAIEWLRLHISAGVRFTGRLEWNLYSRCWGGRTLRPLGLASTVLDAQLVGANCVRNVGCSELENVELRVPPGYHCSWCFAGPGGLQQFRDKIAHIHEADGTDYVTIGRESWPDARIERLMKHGLWLDSKPHGRWVCPRHGHKVR